MTHLEYEKKIKNTFIKLSDDIKKWSEKWPRENSNYIEQITSEVYMEYSKEDFEFMIFSYINKIINNYKISGIIEILMKRFVSKNNKTLYIGIIRIQYDYEPPFYYFFNRRGWRFLKEEEIIESAERN